MSCQGFVEHHGIFLEHTTLYKSWLSPPAVTFALHFVFLLPKTRPVLDLTVPLRVPLLGEMKEVEEESPPPPLTSVRLRLLRQRAPCQTEGWAELRPGATTAALGSFGFDDTGTTIRDRTGTG